MNDIIVTKFDEFIDIIPSEEVNYTEVTSLYIIYDDSGPLSFCFSEEKAIALQNQRSTIRFKKVISQE